MDGVGCRLEMQRARAFYDRPMSGLVLPVSVKGVFGPPGRVVLLHNERDEWELPGGRLDPGDAGLESALEREIREELDLRVEVGAVVHAWRYEPVPGRFVVVISYDCHLVGSWPEVLGHSHEHDGVGLFGIDELAGLALPAGYRAAIAASALGTIRD